MDPLVNLIGQVIGLLDLDEFRPGLLSALTSVVPADWASFNDVAPDPRDTAILVDPPMHAEAHALFAELAHENPLIRRYGRTHDGRAYRFSDVGRPGDFRATRLYRELYARIGLEHQIAFILPHAPDRLLGVALSRKHRDFTEAERDLLNEARPFLIQCYRNAIVHTQLQRALQAHIRNPQLPVSQPALAAELAARGITERQGEVLALVAAGLSDRAVAAELGLSARTVQKHLQLSFRALGVHTREEAVTLAWSLAGG